MLKKFKPVFYSHDFHLNLNQLNNFNHGDNIGKEEIATSRAFLNFFGIIAS
jgi:hypothetical protein